MKLIIAVFVTCLLVISATCVKQEGEPKVEKKAKYNKYEAEQYVSRCPLGWTRYGNEKCFKLSPALTAHAEGEAACNLIGSTLATIASDEESSFVQSLVLKEMPDETVSPNIWIGLRRKAGKLFWFDLGGAVTTTIPWATGEPSAVTGSDCGSVATDYQTLSSLTADFARVKLSDCAELKAALCQKIITNTCFRD